MIKTTHLVTCEGEECELEPIPSYSDLQSSFGNIRSYMESRSCDVSKYVILLVHEHEYHLMAST